MRHFRKKAIQTCLCLLAILTILYFYFQAKSITSNIDNTERYALINLDRINRARISISSLELLHSSTICLYKKPKIMILITSHVHNIDARKMIRRSCPKDLFHKFNVQIIFLLAVAKYFDDNAKQKIQKEFQQYDDIILGNFIEAYRNLTYKHLMEYKWTLDSCSSVKYVVKMDDDIMVNYYKLFGIIDIYI